MQLSDSQLDFLARFQRSPEGKLLIEIYETELREWDVKLRNATGEDVYRLQGRAKQLEEMIERIAKPRKSVASVRPTPLVSRPLGA